MYHPKHDKKITYCIDLTPEYISTIESEKGLSADLLIYTNRRFSPLTPQYLLRYTPYSLIVNIDSPYDYNNKS